MNLVKLFGAIMLSDVLGERAHQSDNALAGSQGGQVGSANSGLGLLDNLTGAFGGGAGSLAELVNVIEQGGGGSIGVAELQAQSGGNSGGNNGGIVSELLVGPGSGQGLGSLIALAIEHNKSDKTSFTQVSEQQSNHAALMIKALVSAANSHLNPAEVDVSQIANRLESVDEQEMQYFLEQLNSPLSAVALAGAVPQGVEQQVYVISLLSANVIDEKGKQYLSKLAKELKLSDSVVKHIHMELGIALLERDTLGGSPV